MKMILKSLGLPAALLLASSVIAGPQETIEKSFSAKPGGKLVMNVDRGSIKVVTGSSDKVEVKVVRELRKGTDAKAKEVFAEHKIEMSQNGDEVAIKAERPSRTFGWRDIFNQLRVEYTVAVPGEFNLNVRTAGGNIDVADLKGEVRVNTSGGNLNLGSIVGPIHAHTSGGNITVQGGKGDSIVNTSGGDIRLREFEGRLEAKTSGGNISIDRVHGAVDAETSGGDIRVIEARGPVTARTSGGNVSAQLMEQPSSDCTLKTSGGNVAITLSGSVAADVHARTSGGSIRSDFPGDMNKQRTKLAAQINGGGPDIVLETSGGNVDIHKK
jgi:hypothetical protein